MRSGRLAAWILVFCVLLLPSCQEARGADTALEIHFLDVGQGDSVLLRTKEGDILIDAGTEDSQERLCLRLGQLGVTELLLAVFTHNDEDHVGGADGVLSQIPAREVWVNDDSADNESAERMLRAVREQGIDLHVASAQRALFLEEVTLSVLYPMLPGKVSGNEGSLILKVNCGEVGLLFTGDAGVAQEEELVRVYGKSQLDCDLYKVGHHGSNTSSGELLLQTVTPQYAVISCGAGNSYGHPMGEVLARLEAHGATVLRTDLEGEIVFETDGVSLTRVYE